MVEIIPKVPKKNKSLQNILFIISLALLITATLAYFGLGNFQKKESQISKDLKNSLLEKTINQERNAKKQEVSIFQNKINSFGLLLDKHQGSSNFFKVFEENIHPKVWFSEIDLNAEKFEVFLSGDAESFQSISQQLALFREFTDIQNVDLLDVSINEKGLIDFSLSFSISPKVFASIDVFRQNNTEDTEDTEDTE
ncbi:MAG: hypothetical protein U9P88_00195 [Patescibacteria group bacterium]|nr:hypothetical protein [Patescibacteria group bacterium]